MQGILCQVATHREASLLMGRVVGESEDVGDTQGQVRVDGTFQAPERKRVCEFREQGVN